MEPGRASLEEVLASVSDQAELATVASQFALNELDFQSAVLKILLRALDLEIPSKEASLLPAVAQLATRFAEQADYKKLAGVARWRYRHSRQGT